MCIETPYSQDDLQTVDYLLVGLVCAREGSCDISINMHSADMMTACWHPGEVSFHSSLNFHKANGNMTDRPREVFTIIFMDQDMTLAEPSNEFQHRDRDA